MSRSTRPANPQPSALAVQPAILSEMVHKIANREAEFTDLIALLSPVISESMPLSSEAALAMAVALNELEEQAAVTDQLSAMVSTHTAAAVAITDAGIVVAANQAASEQLGVQPGDGFAHLGISKAEFQAFKQRLFQALGPTLVKAARPRDDGSLQPHILLGSYHKPCRVFLLTTLQRQWPESIDLALEHLFALSATEREVLAGLAQGLSSESIAEQRGRSVGTVRQQVKAILQKLGANSQLQAATFAAAAANAVGAEQRADRSPSPGKHTLALGEFLHRGRHVGWRSFGHPQGRPVLFFHGPFFGAGEYEHERALAHLYKLHVVAIERPGYGRTDPVAAGQNPLDVMALDARALLDRLGINRALLYSHDIGLVPALALAARSPERVHAIVAASAPAPYREAQQITAMPSQQRIFMWATRHAAWMVRLLIRLGMVRFRKLGPQRWIEAVFGEVPGDMAVLQRPEFADSLIAVYGYNVQQLGKGFEIDLQLVNYDWGPLVAELACPLHLFHGAENQTLPPKFMPVFRKLKPDAQIHWVKEAGQTLALSHTETVFRHLAGLEM